MPTTNSTDPTPTAAGTPRAPGPQRGLETRSFLESRGVDLSGVQQTKTRTALELFTREPAIAG